jgi:hypothetical protein
MKWKFTHKELTLLLGILVAGIIMLTLWLKPFSLESGDVSEKPAQKSYRAGCKNPGGEDVHPIVTGRSYGSGNSFNA